MPHRLARSVMTPLDGSHPAWEGGTSFADYNSPLTRTDIPMLHRLAKILAALLALPLTYLLAAWLLGSIVLTPEDAAGDDITVYLITNGVHTDLAPVTPAPPAATGATPPSAGAIVVSTWRPRTGAT